MWLRLIEWNLLLLDPQLSFGAVVGAPFFLVLNTYRFSPHSKSDDQRDPAEIEERRTRDPLLVAGARLPDEERKAIEERCEERLAETVEAADEAPAAAPGVAA